MRNEYLAIADGGISGFKIYMRTKNFRYFYSRPDNMNNDLCNTNNMSQHISKSAQYFKNNKE